MKLLVEETEDGDGSPDPLLLDEKVQQHLHVRRPEVDLPQRAVTVTSFINFVVAEWSSSMPTKQKIVGADPARV